MKRLTYLLSFALLPACIGGPSFEATDATSGSTTGTTVIFETEGPPPTTTSTTSGGTFMVTETGPITGGEEFCSDGVQQPDEPCDDGPVQNDGHYNGCRFDCELGPHCGDGVINLGWEACDDANNIGGDGCPSDCGVSACGELF